MSELRDDELPAADFVRLTQLSAEAGERLLDALRRARIPAYIEPASDDLVAVFVDQSDRGDAHSILTATTRTTAAAVSPAPDPITAMDTDAAFRELVADWEPVTVEELDSSIDAATWHADDAEADTGEADDSVEIEEHYVPPPPPPLPRLAAPTIGAIALIVAGIVLLVIGTAVLSLPSDLTFLGGVGGILAGAGILVMRLRDRPRPDDDDGAVI